jgi:hypothetical protein
MNTAMMMMLLLPVALAAGLWWLESANDKRAAEHDAVVRWRDAVVRWTYTKDIANSPWIPRKSGDLAAEPSNNAEDDEDEDIAAVLELSASGGFRVQNTAKGSRWMPH